LKNQYIPANKQKLLMPESSALHAPLNFSCGKTMKNRFMLAPMTNKQSHEDGTLSDDEYHWLTMRAKGQFGLVMTCASNVQFNGKCWSGQLGIYDDKHLEGHQRLATGIQAYGSLAVVQLHHGGMRCPADLIGAGGLGYGVYWLYGAVEGVCGRVNVSLLHKPPHHLPPPCLQAQ
jgi:2,4-dienoyl-CoA reductase-like NADH-dependent reductase (Old Yellow Enzyme family)